MTGFDGFPAGGLELLTQLGDGKDKAWFAERRTQYDADVAMPAKAFVSAMGDSLSDRFEAEITAVPKANGSIAPINNDLRFSPDKSPYKDHLLFRFWEGAEKKTSPTLFVRLSESRIGLASGVLLPDIERWRAAIDAPAGAELALALAELGRTRDLEVDGQGYKRVPKPFTEDHARADLLRHKGGFQARWVVDAPSMVSDAGFVEWCTDQLAEAAAVHGWLVDHS